MAITFGWGGSADTDLDFSEFFNHDHTIALWFMPQYIYSYAGPILAESGTGAYLVGMGDYLNWGGGANGWPKLFIDIGGKRQVYDMKDQGQVPPAPDAEVWEDFEDGTYDKWEIEGECFGAAPATGNLGPQDSVKGWEGAFFVNTCNPDESAKGTATSQKFEIKRRYIQFLIGGSIYPGVCGLKLLVDSVVWRSATGDGYQMLLPHCWDVKALMGKKARLQIVDNGAGGGAYVLLDQIVFRDTPPLLRGMWQHLAVVRDGNTFTTYLNGRALAPALTVGSVTAPTGKLRLGKRATGVAVDGSDAQFYGMVDDLAVFKRALTGGEVRQLMNATHLTGDEPGLHAGWRFLPATNAKVPAKLSRPVTLHGAAQLVKVSSGRSHEADAALLPLPLNLVTMELPFKPGDAWQVIQGYDDGAGSHKGYAAFCWDFIIADQPQSGQYPNGTKNAPFYACAPGTVTLVKEDQDSGTGVYNYVEVTQAAGEIAAYLHLALDSVEASPGGPVKRGQKLAEAGDTGVATVGANHLHLAVADMTDKTPGFVTFPAKFVNYEVRTDEGGWELVEEGVPAMWQVVRRPKEQGGKLKAGPDTNLYVIPDWYLQRIPGWLAPLRLVALAWNAAARFVATLLKGFTGRG